MTAAGHADVGFQRLAATALRRNPEQLAVVDGDLRWTGRSLARRVGAATGLYRDLGLGPGSRIALLSPNSAHYIAAQLGAVMAGCTFTGLHPLGSADDHRVALERLGADALVVDPQRFGNRAAELVGSGAVNRVVDLGPGGAGEDLTALPDAELSVTDVGVDAEASISFSGGTTGHPKGVVRSHRALAWSAMLMVGEWDWPRVVRFLAIAPLTHATGAMVVPVLLRGGQLHIHDGFDAGAVLAAVEENGITATFVVPTMLYALLDHPDIDRRDLSSLQHIIYGAAPAAPARLAEAMARFGPVLMQLYGQVEAPNTITALRTTEHRADDPARLASCGKPLAGLDVALLNSAGTEVAPGTPGEICVRGPLVMDGYLDNEEATAEALEGGWLHTGDIAVADEDGYLTIVDRAKDMIVTGGFNVYPREVEDVLATHASVASTAVIGVPDDHWGEAVVAYVTTRPGETIDVEALQALVRERKGPVHTPKAIHVVDTIAVTALGKPDKKALRNLHWTGETRGVH
ncbi:MAG: AMP-binding protein [Acidimicrobiales bacterium]